MKFSLKRRHVVILIVIAFAIFAIFSINKCIKNDPDFRISGTNTVPKEYWNLFPKSIRSKMLASFSLTPKKRGVISQFTYDNHKYYIDVFKIDTIGKKLISDVITLSDVNNLKIDYVPYFNMAATPFDINYRTILHKASHIYLNIYGGPITILIKNDTIASYYSAFKIFSVKYDKSDTTAIWARTEGQYPELPKASFPINIVFIKKNASLYFLTMSVNDPAASLEPDKLYDLLSGKE